MSYKSRPHAETTDTFQFHSFPTEIMSRCSSYKSCSSPGESSEIAMASPLTSSSRSTCRPGTSYEKCPGRRDYSLVVASSPGHDRINHNSHGLTTSATTAMTTPTKRKRWSPSRIKGSCQTVKRRLVHLVMCHGHSHGHGHGRLWSKVKAGCTACFKPKDRDISRVVPSLSTSASAKAREEKVKAAILYCKNSIAAN